MATKPAQFIQAEAEDAEFFEVMTTGPNGQATAQQKAFEDLISELGENPDDAAIHIYRQNTSGKTTMTLLEVFPVDQFDFVSLWSHVREKYGAGHYRIHVRKSGKLVANKLIEIEQPKVTDKPGVTPIGEASSILATVLERQEKMHQQMLALIQQSQQPQHSRQEMLQEMLMFKQLFDNGGNGGGNAIAQLRDTLTVLGELGINIGGASEEKETGFGDLLEKMTPLLGAAMTQPQQPQQKRDPMFAQKMMLKNGIGQLMRAAAKNSPREVYADLVLDQLPENVVKEFITAPDAFEKLIKLEPRAAQFRPWFMDLAEHVKAALGMPSQYADLYGDDDDAINAGNDIEPAPNDDGTDHI